MSSLPDWFINKVKMREGFRATPYWDHGHYAIGYGSKANPGETSITEAEANGRLVNDLAKAQRTVDGVVPQDAPEGVRLALTSLTQNAGTKWVNDGLGDYARQGNWPAAQARLQRYVNASGREQPGLVARRADESQWMAGNTPDAQQPQATAAAAPPRPPANIPSVLQGVNPRLVAAVQGGATFLPPGYTVQPTSGVRHGNAQSYHNTGSASDWQIIDPSGKPIANKGEDSTGLYTQLARGVKTWVGKNDPQLASQIGYGGAFGTEIGGGGVPDLMHYDLGGSRGRMRPDVQFARLQPLTDEPGAATSAAPPWTANALPTSAPERAAYAPSSDGSLANTPAMRAIASAVKPDTGGGDTLGPLSSMILPMVRGNTTDGMQAWPKGDVPSLFSTNTPPIGPSGVNPLMTELTTPGLKSMSDPLSAAGPSVSRAAPVAAPSSAPAPRASTARPPLLDALKGMFSGGGKGPLAPAPNFQDQWNTGGATANLPLSPLRTPAPRQPPARSPIVAAVNPIASAPQAGPGPVSPPPAPEATPPAPPPSDQFGAGWPRQTTPDLPWPTPAPSLMDATPMAQRGDQFAPQQWNIAGANLSPMPMGNVQQAAFAGVPPAPELAGDLAGPATPANAIAMPAQQQQPWPGEGMAVDPMTTFNGVGPQPMLPQEEWQWPILPMSPFASFGSFPNT